MPKSYKLALTIPHWHDAMKEEIKALNDNQTWTFVSRLANKHNWVIMDLLNELQKDSLMDRFKACLVAQGYTQVKGLDYKETYSPVIKMTTIKLVLAIVTCSKWKMRQLDVKKCVSSWLPQRNSMYEATSRI